MALPPIRGIAALLKHLSKGGKGTARKPLLGKAQLDRALTNQADFDSLMRAGSGEILPHRDVVGKSYFKGGRANRNIPAEYYGRGGTQTTDAAQHGGPDQWAADRMGPRIADEPPGLRRARRRPSARERREERIAGVMRRQRGPLDDVNALESELSGNQSDQLDTIRRMIEVLQAELKRNV